MNLPPTVGFPFWGGQDNWRPKNCGYPDMEIRCDNGINASITIKGMVFEVLHVDMLGRNMVIARRDYENGTCLRSLVNTTLDYRRFSYAPRTLNITALYGCSRPKKSVFGKFKCAIEGVKENFGYYARGVVDPSNYNCHSAVIVPIQEFLEFQLFTRSLSYVFREGFKVNYTLTGDDDAFCQKCAGEKSNGKCGYDTKTNKTVCVCPYGIRDSMCKGKRNSQIIVIIGSCVVGGVIAVGLLFFIAREIINRQLLRTENPTPDQTSAQPPQQQLTPSHPSPNSILEESRSYMGLKLFSHSELEVATDGFNESRELGDGAFATVYHGELVDGTEVAVKRFYESSVRRMGQFMNEVNILARLRHEHLVRLYGCTSRTSKDVLLVYEFVSNGTVADHLYGKHSSTSNLSSQLRLSIATETAEGLCFLHQNDVIHRDVKSANILLDSTFKVKVADFGLARLFPEDVSHVSTVPQGTPGYVDPQYHRCYRLSEKSDVYSFGVVLMELISSKAAVDITRRNNDANLAIMAVDRFKKNAMRELVDPTLGYGGDPLVNQIIDSIAQIGVRCLQEDDAVRPTMQEVLDCLRNVGIS
ncbi:hypothetical protein RND81_12G209500 [Saponaria officinalis]|uniref:non-specific serine/threonine protein kinase n=1 Tax=Saponaria officinalis TaxID=3572 RepID=A0AAW1HDJ6_SAPOF